MTSAVRLSLRPPAATPYDKDGNAIAGGPRIYPEMAGAGLWATPSDLALFTLAIQDPLAGKPGAIVTSTAAREMLQPVRGNYALGFAIDGNGANRYFSRPGANAGFLSFFFAYEKGDGAVLMANSQYSKALMLEVIDALAKQYRWTEFPTDDSRFNNPWVIGLTCSRTVVIAYLLFRVIRQSKSVAPH
jgi:CubicO group peptidase (beta-lactamase class C family)